MITTLSTEKIKRSFNQASKTYQTANTLQRNVLEQLISHLLPFGDCYDVISDFACGVGVSTQKLVSKIKNKKIYAIDISNDSLNKASIYCQNLNIVFIEGDYHNLVFQPNYLDLAFCNMGFQWSYDLSYVFSQIYHQLKPNGLIAFSIPLIGTFSTLKKDFRLDFLSKNEVIKRLSDCGFRLLDINLYEEKQNFDNPLSSLKRLKLVGANLNLKSSNSKGLMTKNNLNQFFTHLNQFDLDYEIGIFIGQKH